MHATCGLRVPGNAAAEQALTALYNLAYAA